MFSDVSQSFARQGWGRAAIKWRPRETDRLAVVGKKTWSTTGFCTYLKKCTCRFWTSRKSVFEWKRKDKIYIFLKIYSMFLNHFQVNNFHYVYYNFLNYDILIYETVFFVYNLLCMHFQFFNYPLCLKNVFLGAAVKYYNIYYNNIYNKSQIVLLALSRVGVVLWSEDRLAYILTLNKNIIAYEWKRVREKIARRNRKDKFRVTKFQKNNNSFPHIRRLWAGRVWWFNTQLWIQVLCLLRILLVCCSPPNTSHERVILTRSASKTLLNNTEWFKSFTFRFHGMLPKVFYKATSLHFEFLQSWRILFLIFLIVIKNTVKLHNILHLELVLLFQWFFVFPPFFWYRKILI